MPPFILLLLKLLPYLPTVIKTVEAIHGPGNGPTKLDTAVTLLQAVVPAVTEHLKAEPANTDKLSSLIGTVVAGLNAADTWKAQQDSTSMGG